jgi:hypothetical protein
MTLQGTLVNVRVPSCNSNNSRGMLWLAFYYTLLRRQHEVGYSVYRNVVKY